MAVTTRRREEPRAQQAGGAGRFLRDVYDELRKVVWPTWPELYRYTVVVLVTVVILGVFIGGIDYLLGAITKATIYNNGVH